MKNRVGTIALFLLSTQLAALLLAGCGAADKGPDPVPPPSVRSETPGSSVPEAPVESVEKSPLPITDPGAIQEELWAAILSLRQPAKMDISGAGLSDTPELDVKNLYYELLNEHPELKYAYDITAETESGLLTCQISYMLYKTGYPPDWQGVPAGSLPELIETANAHLGSAPVTIRLTDAALTPDEMNRALQQVGGGYILCALSRDGTQLTYAPAPGMTVEECEALLAQAEALSAELAGTLIADAMTQREKAEALYTYLIRSVKYDQRYYTDLSAMPCDSRTAIGALRDGVAICGGYSHALVLLFGQAGIPCYTVSGQFGSENHMWNIARLDGQWLWFDATADRSASPQYRPRHFAQEELDDRYFWDHAQLNWLLTEQDV